MVTQLIYASRAMWAVSLPDLKQINTRAVRSNASNGITGLLLYGASRFLQVLEGERDDVNRTYERISRDDRHFGLTLISLTEVSAPRFSRWAMRFVMLEHACGTATKAALSEVSASKSFEPLALSANAALELLGKVAQLG